MYQPAILCFTKMPQNVNLPQIIYDYLTSYVLNGFYYPETSQLATNHKNK